MNSFTSRYRKSSNVLFTCEHASGRIPRTYKKLGLQDHELRSAEGDWYDLGSGELAKELSALFGSSYLFANFSRLLIDYNRRLDGHVKEGDTFHACALKEHLLIFDGEKESKISIPGNCKTNIKEEEKKRWKKFVLPYQEAGLKLAGDIVASQGHGYVIQVHSFSPIYNGQWRDVDIGVIYDTERLQEGHLLVKELRSKTNLAIGDNKPWGIADVDGGIFKDLHQNKKITIMTLEVKNSLLNNTASIKKIADLFASAFVRIFPAARPVVRKRVTA